MAKLPKREITVFVGGDFHCSHRVGLTPPTWQWKSPPAERKSNLESVHQHKKYGRIQAECWKTYTSLLKQTGPFDAAFLMGDLIDGTGPRSGGTELITTDRDVQRDMAIQCIEAVDAKTIVGVRGTPYHTGNAEDWEDQVYTHFRNQGIQAKVGDHEWPRIHGVTFDLKHKVGSSSIPHGAWTALGKEWLWNQLWADAGYTPQADFIFRGHVHTAIGGWRFVGGRRVEVASTPALQALGSKYGARQCSRLVDWGFYVLHITPKGNVKLDPYVIQIDSQKATAMDL